MKNEGAGRGLKLYNFRINHERVLKKKNNQSSQTHGNSIKKKKKKKTWFD